MIIGLKLKKDYFDELEKRLRMLEEKSVKVGVFDNSPRGDGFFTNVSLFTYLSMGDIDRNLVPRPVLEITMTMTPIEKSPMKKELTKYFNNINRKKGEGDVMKLLQAVGGFYRDAVAQNFGNTSILADNTEWTQRWKESLGYTGNAPLLMTGELQGSIAFKIDGQIWNYGDI